MIRATLVISLLLVASLASAGEWPAWRGPRGDGQADEPNVPTKWSTSENVHWKVPIPGGGHSSPIVFGDRIFLTTATESDQKRSLLCLNRADGKTIWEREVLRAPLEHRHERNSYASATPATDGKHVWVSFLGQPNIQLACYDMDGNEVWRKSPGTFSSVHGFCSSPVLYKDLVILNGDQDAQAWIVAFDKLTGEARWRTDRPNRVRSYCTPLVIDVDGKPQLTLSGSKSVASYNPDDGKQIWLIDGPTDQFVASLAYADGILLATGGFPQLHIVAINPRGSGNVTGSNIVWRTHKGASYVPSPVAHGDYFFVVADNGIASCFEARTGELKWKERLGRRHSASLVTAGGNVYFLDDDGETFVVKAGPQFELVSQNSLGESCFATPAVSHGQLFIRTASQLYCIGKPDDR